MCTTPAISVLLPVYNGSRYLREALNSILQQTCADFELIIINDGSKDDSADIIASFEDPRIRYFEQENIGLAATLNRAISLSRGAYLARQDQDDISYPERFEKQLHFLEEHPACGMVGTWAEIWQEEEKTGKQHLHPADNATLQFELLFNNPFVHSSLMIRREVFDRVGLYCTDTSRQPPEDYEMWSRIARSYEVANIPEVLHVYRGTGAGMSQQNWQKIMDKVVLISAENIAFAAGAGPFDPDVVNTAALVNCVFRNLSGRPSLMGIKKVFDRAAQSVAGSCRDETGSLALAVKTRWRNLCFNYYQCSIRPALHKVLDVFRKKR